MKILTLLTALFLAACSGWFSVFGISQLFISTPLSAILMASSMEVAKLVSVSFVYRNWKSSPKLLKIYMLSGTIILSLITSVGVYGYLFSSYAQSASDFKLKQDQVRILDEEIARKNTQIARIDARVIQLQDIQNKQETRLDRMSSTRQLRLQQNASDRTDKNIQLIEQDRKKLTQELDSLQNYKNATEIQLASSSKISTFSYLANILGISLDTMIGWFILCLVAVFDPMAIALTIAYNFYVKKEILSIPEKQSNDSIRSDIIDDVVVDNINEGPVRVETHNGPYYTDPAYDWSTDDRWKTDTNAVLFKSKLENSKS